MRTEWSANVSARQVAAFAAWLLLLACAIALSVAVVLDDVLPGELRVLKEVQNWDWLGGTFADAIRFITGTEVVVATGAIIAVVLWVRGERRAALTVAIALVLVEIAQPLIKEIVDRPRPSDDEVDIRGSITSPSFPAGHVMSPTVLYGALIALVAMRPAWPSALRVATVAACVFIVVATGFVNLYLGVHWPSDVLGGWLWGAVVIVAAFALARWIPLRA
jgi:undecaprenyl-diphosphatase